MNRQQIYALTNDIAKEVLGESFVLQEDLSNVVDMGKTIINNDDIDTYVKSLLNHIGRVWIGGDRVYKGQAPKVFMDSWEFGSVVEKINIELPDAMRNESYSLQNGTSYDPNIFYQPVVHAKFFNQRDTFQIPMSFTEKGIKESFSNAQQYSAFIAGLYNAIDKAMTVRLDGMVMATIRNAIAETIHDEFPTSTTYSTNSGVRAINVLKLYNDTLATPLTQAQALADADFFRFTIRLMNLYKQRLAKLSTLFNIGEKPRFTSSEMLNTVLLADFESAVRAYLYDGTGQFNIDDLKLPDADVVAYWQGSGTDYAFSSTSKVKVKTTSNDIVDIDGVIGVMFDRDALGVTCIDQRVTTNYNGAAEFINQWHKFDAGYFNDFDENIVVFFMK